MKKIILILLLSITTNLVAQKDTLYFKPANSYGQTWIKTTKKYAEFYRPMPLKKAGNLYQIKNYYMNGNLQMEGFCADPKKEFYSGMWSSVSRGLDGLEKTYFKDGTLKTEGNYKNNEPFDGTFDVYWPIRSVVAYKKGKRTASFRYYKNSKIIAKKTFKDNDEYSKKEISYDEKGNEIGRVTLKPIGKYQDGRRVYRDIDNQRIISIIDYKEGKRHGLFIQYDSKGNIITEQEYKQGAKNGPFTEYTYNHVFIEGNYKDDLWDGTLTFTDRIYNRITTCIYAKGNPIDGTVISNKCVSTYKNGLKSGLESCTKNLYIKINNDYQLIYDTITQHYKKGKLDGKIQYFKAGTLVSQGIYEQNHKIEGTFYSNKTFQNFYKDGKLVTSTYHFGLNKKIDTFENGLITKEVVHKGDTIVSKGIFKNGNEYNGTFITIDNKEEPRSFTRASYKDGLKHGKEQIINLIENKIEATNIYKAGIPLQKIKKFPFKDLDSIIGVYKKGKPFSGHFYTEKNTIEKIEHYKKGIKTGYQYYYSTTGSLLKPILDSINYIKGKPFDGIDLEVVNKAYHKHFYKNGKQTQTDVLDSYYHEISDFPVFRVIPTNTGFVISRSNGNKLTYTNKDKTEGKVEFFIKNENFTIKIYPELKLANSPSYKDFLDWDNLRGDVGGVAYFYLDNELLGKCTFRKGNPHNGIVIKRYKDGMFKYAKYKEGERIEKKKGLTKEELLKLLEKK